MTTFPSSPQERQLTTHMQQSLCKGVLIIQLMRNQDKESKVTEQKPTSSDRSNVHFRLRFLNLKKPPYNLSSTRSAFKVPSFLSSDWKNLWQLIFPLTPDRPHQMWSHRFWKEGGVKKPPLPLTLCLQLYQSSPGCGRALLLHGHTTDCCARAQAFLGICSGPVPATDYLQIGQGLTSPIGNAKALHRISWGWHKTLREHGCSTEYWLENCYSKQKTTKCCICHGCVWSELGREEEEEVCQLYMETICALKNPKNHQTRNVTVNS